MARYLLETYGCQMNVADSELIAGLLHEAGWEPCTEASAADLIIVNTCAVRERAAERVIGHVRSYKPLKKRNPALRIALVGCLARYGGADLAARLPEVDLFLGPDAYRRLPHYLAPGWRSPSSEIGLRREETYAGLRPRRTGGVNAWISVMRGCDRRCAYCVVPLARGRERSLPQEEVLRAARAALAEGFPSLTLLGQTVTSYRDGGRDFAALLTALAPLPGLRRLRFLAPHPADFTPRLIETIRDHPLVCRHLHLPVQSGSDRVLTAMRRDYTRDEFLRLVAALRSALPGIALTTDLIVGFPGEADEEFRATLELMRTVRFDGAFMFAYSPRPRTYAERFLSDDVSAEEKRRRLEEVIALQEEHSRERFASRIGRRVAVLVEGPARQPPGHYFGKSDDFKDTFFVPRDAAKPTPGTLVSVAVTAASSHSLRGEQLPDEVTAG